ncbi:hypothetical protein NEMIN01_2235 [Nematocida minor]|uniref:uncharacterized protein n=1 Tax=Nematocida minor TaxID=1912983 RepID=UPI00221F69ED|nr:uncharacterized protein NEMIN01_2235 [Nematocida minor]KAI5192819.1 hypothetical protein NEMIN01_2235 [Nematocida minor]
MKKREGRRQIDLLSNIPAVSLEKISPLTGSIGRYSVDYNTLMEEYEAQKGNTKLLFLLTGNNDPSVYQLIPLFCKHFGISVFKIEEKMHVKGTPPVFIRVQENDPVLDTLNLQTI